MPSIYLEARGREYLKQIKFSFLFKMGAILVSYFSVPLILEYLGLLRYGVWSTILSIFSWLVLFDFGLGNGLRNKIAESMVTNDRKATQEYVSTTYGAILGIVIVLAPIYFLLTPFVDWAGVFNTGDKLDASEIKFTVDLAVVFMLANFVVCIINQVLNGMQKSGAAVFNQFLSGTIFFVCLFFLPYFSSASLKLVTLSYGASLCAAGVAISIWFYLNNKWLVPKLSLVKKRCLKVTASLGVKFFLIQIAVVVLFTTDKIIIAQLLGPEYVAEYDVLFKLFSIVTILHGVVMGPLWNSYSDAFHRNDFPWMKGMLNKQVKIFFVFALALLMLVGLCPFFIRYWIGGGVVVRWPLAISISLFVLVSIWNNVFAIFLNGISETRLQIRTAVFSAIINIPCSIFIVKYFNLGSEGVVLGSVIALSIFSLLGPIESFRILNRDKHAAIS